LGAALRLWRDFVFELLSQRLSTVMAIVDEVAFQRMDRRVASLLLKMAKTKNPLRITHQEIASELGSSREVISRLLEDLLSEGSIRSGRGTVSKFWILSYWNPVRLCDIVTDRCWQVSYTIDIKLNQPKEIFK
jgi:hypothetical protein